MDGSPTHGDVIKLFPDSKPSTAMSDAVSTTETTLSGHQETTGKSSIQVIFTDWVSENDVATTEEPGSMEEDHSYKPRFKGGRPRYFQNVYGAHGRIRPGLGMKLDDVSAPKKVKRKKAIDLSDLSKKIRITTEKPACAFLNELNPNLSYEFHEEKATADGLPNFVCTVNYPPLSDNKFIGEGRSKKLAKNNAAKKVLKTLGFEWDEMTEQNEFLTANAGTASNPVSSTELSTPTVHEGVQNPLFEGQIPLKAMQCQEMDFTSDDMISATTFRQPMLTTLSQPMVCDSILKRLKNIPNIDENVCLALNTIVFPNTVEFNTLAEEGPSHDRVFTVQLRLNSQLYEGQGGSKKKAKADAAKKAVVNLIGMDCYAGLVQNSSQISEVPTFPIDSIKQLLPKSKKSKRKRKADDSSLIDAAVKQPDENKDSEDDDVWGEYDLNFSDHVRNSVQEKYEELMGKDPNFSSYKVLAGVVMTVGSPMIYNSEVISVTTGTKCVEGNFLSLEGLTLNDNHAEILATRCLRDFIYSQIELIENGSAKDLQDCILESCSIPGSKSKYRLKSEIKFHLYISTAPCGDARIFSPKGIQLDDDDSSASTTPQDNHPNKMNRGVLRSKIEAGEGTIPAANLYNGPQTWDAIVSGNALYTMSCSDKVCRWNVLGVQGALLYNFVGSIYYSSITLGSLHHPVHFKRAVYGRIQPLNSRLEIPFCINKPKLLMVSKEEKRVVKKSPNHAVCWSVNWSTPEILSANKGRCEPGGVASRLTKRVLFSRFLKLYKNITGRREHYMDLSYHEAKNEAVEYQNAKAEFVQFCKEQNMGPWIGKPLEQDSFKIQ